MTIIRFDSLESTNKYCEALDLAQVEDFTCYWALEQTAGIGQRGNLWHSAAGENLTFSLVLHPDFLPAAQQFKLTQALSLALVDFLSTFNFQLSVSIKWPNDIYVDGKKICGTLASTRLQGNVIASAICGIGLNVNEQVFPDWIPHPTSLSLLTGQKYNLEPQLRQLLACIEKRYNDLKSGIDPEREYLAYLLNLNVRARYIYNKEDIAATITGIDPHGRLLLTTDDGRSISCGMKEIIFLN
jgi:BirA family biotin operon repressor/biotin-[acetyl-CoA-carboxylase] ligase